MSFELKKDNKKKYFGFGKNIFFAGAVSFFMDISSEMIYPLVPLFLANVLGVNKSLIGLIEGVVESTASLLKVFSGWFSDRIGRRKGLMVIGYGISTLSRPIMATAAFWQQVLAFRFIDRMGKGIRTAPRDAIIADSAMTTHLASAFGLHRAMDTMGAVLGPALALFFIGLFNSDYRKVFWISTIPAVISVLMIIFFIREKRNPRISHGEKPGLSFKHFDWRVRLFIWIATIFALGNSSDVFLILRAGQVGIPSAMIPAVYLLFNLVYSISSIPAGIAADRFGRKRIILLGFVLFSILYCGFGIVNSATGVWLLFGMYGLFMGLTEGIQKAFLVTITPPGLKATTLGVYGTCIGLSMFPASLIGGLLWDHVSPSATFYFGAITAAVAAVLFISLIASIKGNTH